MRWARTVGWRPGRPTWRVAVGFMAGAALFALGSVPFYSQTLPPRTVGITFVVGAVFFTLAAAGQLQLETTAHPPGGGRLLLRLTWWAAAVQLVGTLLFNVSTTNAMLANLDVHETNRLVWAPDLFGSAAFLVASWLAWRAVCPSSAWCRRPADPDWWMALLNGVGSILFGLSAIGAVTLPTTGDVLNLTLVNSTTALGAACFFLGAWLMLPEQPRPHAAAPRDRRAA